MDIESSRSTTLTLQPNNAERLSRLCGQLGCNLRQIEARLGVRIRHRGNQFHLQGEEGGLALAEEGLRRLYEATEGRVELTTEEVNLSLLNINGDKNADGGRGRLERDATEPIRIHLKQRDIEARNANQGRYIKAIRKHVINFGVGPAGTGKTHLAVACAVEALEQRRTERIILTRPALEAGERLGFLPGDLSQKINPYLQPLYDELHQLLGKPQVDKLLARGHLEVAPLAYMRGRTFGDAFVILDEAQNTTPAQLKMFLTRIGFNATAIVNGDLTQTDLPPSQRSGLAESLGKLRDIDGISFTRFGDDDIMRHPLVQRIVQAWNDERHSDD